MGVTVTVVVPCGCHGRSRCATWVSWSQSLRHVSVVVTVIAPRGCRGHSLCTVWVSWSWSLHHVGVMVMVFVPRGCHSHGLCATWVSQSWSLHHMWCRCRSHCATYGVAIAVFVLCGCHSHGHRAVWCCGHGGCHHATWCRSHHRHVVTGPQKRKLVEKRKKKTYQQVNAVCAATRGMATQCVWVQGHGEVGACQCHRGWEWGLVGPQGRGRCVGHKHIACRYNISQIYLIT